VIEQGVRSFLGQFCPSWQGTIFGGNERLTQGLHGNKKHHDFPDFLEKKAFFETINSIMSLYFEGLCPWKTG
jgi:hypothetical protein